MGLVHQSAAALLSACQYIVFEVYTAAAHFSILSAHTVCLLRHSFFASISFSSFSVMPIKQLILFYTMLCVPSNNAENKLRPCKPMRTMCSTVGADEYGESLNTIYETISNYIPKMF